MKIIPKFLWCIVLLFAAANLLEAQPHSPKLLRILTYNVQFLPGFAIHLKHFPHKRALHIADAIIADSIDVVVFQEMFDARGRRMLEKKMRDVFPYMVGPGSNKPKGWRKGSGVMMMSRYPLKPLEKIKYSECKGIDCLAGKGVMAVEVDYPLQRFQIFGTHLQAFSVGDVMLSQLNDFGALLRKHQMPDVPQFSAGDFNIRKADTVLYAALLRALQSEDGELTGEVQWTSDFATNDMNHYKDEYRDLIDYILYKGNGIQPQSIKREVKIYRHRWSKRNQDLSDHFGVMMEVGF